MWSKVKVLVLLLIPVLLWGWGNDILISTTHASNYQTPVSYDMVWINDTLMFSAIAYNDTTTAYVVYYKSTDAGASWDSVNFWTGSDLQVSSIDLEYYGDSLYTLWVLTNGDIAITKIDFNGRGWVSYYNSEDSTINAFLEIADRSGSPILYIATTEATADVDSFTIYKSTDYGTTWNTVVNEAILRGDYERTIRDFDFAIKSDTILLYYTYERKDTASNDHNIWTNVYKDDPSGNVTYGFQGAISYDATLDTRYPSLTALGEYVVCLYEANGDIFYSYSTDYGVNFTRDIAFPFNTTDSTEFAAYARWWSTFLSSGYNIIYIRENSLYYVETQIVADTISWGTPVLVSDQHTPEYYSVSLFNYSYRPKLVNRYNLATPAVIWNQDYYHYSWPYPIPLYDSTKFYTDNMIATGVGEIAINKHLNIKVNTFATNNLHLEFSTPVDRNMKLFIFDVQGRKVKESEIVKGTQEITLDVHALKPGIYFLRIRDRQATETRKFIKVR
ncbi:MAG: T9SS type A sorting domain-containing protein [Candidatus Verstraetearchaeota archaeon]|nr:T9SS type A sorting domain-containing protein [Candidatus Verstraetearchaeota archaeon]